VHLVQLTLGRLHEGDRVSRVAVGLVEAGDLSTQLLADRESGRVVGSGVDPLTGRQPRHRILELVLRSHQLAMGVHRFDVGVDPE
jgi:hypothetical protein